MRLVCSCDQMAPCARDPTPTTTVQTSIEMVLMKHDWLHIAAKLNVLTSCRWRQPKLTRFATLNQLYFVLGSGRLQTPSARVRQRNRRQYWNDGGGVAIRQGGGDGLFRAVLVVRHGLMQPEDVGCDERVECGRRQCSGRDAARAAGRTAFRRHSTVAHSTPPRQ